MSVWGQLRWMVYILFGLYMISGKKCFHTWEWGDVLAHTYTTGWGCAFSTLIILYLLFYIANA